MSDVEYLSIQLENTKGDKAILKRDLKRAHARQALEFLPQIVKEYDQEPIKTQLELIYKGSSYKISFYQSARYDKAHKAYPGVYVQVSTRLPKAKCNSVVFWRFTRVPTSCLDNWFSISQGDREFALKHTAGLLHKRLIKELS